MQVLRVAAYVNVGRWVADCPRPYCGNAEELRLGQQVFECTVPECRLVAMVWWHRDAEAVWRELLRRPMPATRNWAPAQHRQAIACHVPHGQTVADLRAEFAAHDPLGYAIADLVGKGNGAIRLTPAALELMAPAPPELAAADCPPQLGSGR